MKLTKEQLTEKYRERIGDPLRFSEIRTFNHKPDLFCIGPAHVAYAAEHCCGRLGEEAAKSHVCYHCREPYEKHTHETGIAVEVVRACTEAEVLAALRKADVEAGDGIDGFALVKGFDLIERTKPA